MKPPRSFEGFVVGPSNLLAHTACLAVSRAPQQCPATLFIHGPTGLGKTHLLQAIEHDIGLRRPETKVSHLTAEKFHNEYLRSIQENTLPDLQQRYHGLDVLLLDDLQFLSDKDVPNENSLQNISELFAAPTQIVFSADRLVSAVVGLGSSLLSHIRCGQSIMIQSPDFETRVTILHVKAAALNLHLSVPIIEFLAQRIPTNIRRLEGVMIRISCHATRTGKPLDLATVELLLNELPLQDGSLM